MTILVTGAAGFIGFHLCKKLIENQIEVIGLDNINKYYDVNLKLNRIKYLNKTNYKNKKLFKFIEGDLINNHDFVI